MYRSTAASRSRTSVRVTSQLTTIARAPRRRSYQAPIRRSRLRGCSSGESITPTVWRTTVIADAVRSRRDARTEDVLASDCRTGRSGGVVTLELVQNPGRTTIPAVDDSGHDPVSV